MIDHFNYNVTSTETDKFRTLLKDRMRSIINTSDSYLFETTFFGYFNNTTVIDIVSDISRYIPNCSIEFLTRRTVEFSNDKMGFIADIHSLSDPFDKQDRLVSIYLYSTPEIIEPIWKDMKQRYTNTVDPVITWYYEREDKKLESKDFFIAPNKSFHSEFYPYLGDIDKFCNDFNTSSANILILLGPPGTGKTSFLKHFLKYTKNNAITTYDQNVMTTDSLYVNFLNSTTKYLILEDSDILLLSREKDDNRVMSKILNASDGLVSTDKKFIFTANLANDSQIDEAMVRPGRCFGVKHFRELTQEEGLKVANKLNKQLPMKDHYSLAEIFNGMTTKPKMSFGFNIGG